MLSSQHQGCAAPFPEPRLTDYSLLADLFLFSGCAFATLASCCCGLTGLRTLSTVLRTTLDPAAYTGGVQGATDDVVTYAWQVFNPAATNQHDAVFLEVVAFTGDVCVYFLTVGKAHTGHFAHSRVRLLRRGGIHASAYAPTLRARIKSRRLRLGSQSLPTFPYELVDGWHLAIG